MLQELQLGLIDPGGFIGLLFEGQEFSRYAAWRRRTSRDY
jgi:hypothetical protein